MVLSLLFSKKGTSLISVLIGSIVSIAVMVSAVILFSKTITSLKTLREDYQAYAIAKNEYDILSNSNFYDLSSLQKTAELKDSPWQYDISIDDIPKPIHGNSEYKEGNIKFYRPNKNFTLYSETMKKTTGYTGLFDEENGYVKLPNGLTLQYGRKYINHITDSNNTGEYIYIQFPQKILNAVASVHTKHYSNGDAYICYIKSLSETEAIIVTDAAYYDYPHGYVYWQAIGY